MFMSMERNIIKKPNFYFNHEISLIITRFFIGFKQKILVKI
jgi:hypothetical protein